MSDFWALVISVSLPALLLLAIWRWARGPRTLFGVSASPDRPRAFGYKSTWLAVRSEEPEEVVTALRSVDPRFRDATPCNWEQGLARVFGALMSREAFVTPSLRGWVLVVGYTPETHPATATRGKGTAALRSLERLGAALGRPLYYFGSHRGISYVDWVVVENGETKRAYGWADGTLYYDEGKPPPEEVALGLKAHAESRDEDDAPVPSERTVIELASRWTLNPLELGAIEEPSAGVLVRFS